MSDRPQRRARDAEVLVIGAGTSGSVLATLLARRGVDVVLLEAGGVPVPPPWWSLRGAFDPATSDGAEVLLDDGRMITTRRGRGVGGSAAVNGCYWIRGTADDHRDWVDATGDPRWSPDRLDGLADTLEDDLDAERTDRTRIGGPIPVWRDADLEPVSDAFAAAATARGHRWVDDLNGGTLLGVGPVPFNVRDGRRVDPAEALGLRGPTAPSGVRLEASTRVDRLEVEHGRVVGVDALGPSGPRRWRAERVVCCAGSLGTATLLLRSGIGPAHHLRAAGHEVVADLPVGAAAWDHPCIDLPYLPRPGVVPDTVTSFMQLALHLEGPEPGGLVEILPTRRPYGVVTGEDPADRLLHLRVTLLQPRSRVRVRLGPGEAPELSQVGPDPLGDLPALCAAVAITTALARTSDCSAVVADWHGPTSEHLGDPAQLDAWVAERVGSAYHLGGTAPMGRPDTPGAVVDGQLRVIGVAGLWVADAAVLPTPLRRGPAATAAVLGAMAVDLVTSPSG